VLKRLLIALVLAGVVVQVRFDAAAPVRYRFSFPEPQHRWMQVEATFPELGQAPLELRMSRSSPGRYAVHDFAKNVYDVHAYGDNGQELPTSRPDASGWTVGGHGETVTVRYKVYGDRIDGTYLAVDTTHAHINMPAAVMWARGLDDRAATVAFDPPAGTRWQVATQLHAGSTAFQFTAPNLQYLMDSPAEFGPVVLRQFSVGPRMFRFAVHHTGTDGDLDGFVRDVEKVVRQEGAIYGEYPDFEPGYYTFLADYLPYATGDGMEHRNSTVMTSAGSIARSRAELLDTVAHEFFHAWNVERIRPHDLEPFDLDGPNTSGALWLAEGFTQYYGPLVLQRAGLVDTGSTALTLAGLVEAVSANPGGAVRSAEQMSRMAPFTDGARPIDRTNWTISVMSYYPQGAAIALALDLTLRERSNGETSLDTFMRAMWRRFGKPGGAREGYVDRPYSLADAEATLAEVGGGPAFARDFFARYIQGHDVADYARLLGRAGFVLRTARMGAAWLGDVRIDTRSGVARLETLVAPTWPIYATGVDQDDEIQQMAGDRIRSIEDVNGVLRRHKPGDRIEMVFVDRGGAPRRASLTLGADPRRDVVPVETGGGVLTPAQKSFRDAWLGPK
jgi:predicted metalloprotease with PDZ domain